MFGYKKYAVLPTPAAPIIRVWTSPVSTSATVFFPEPLHPTTVPWITSPLELCGRFSPLRHLSGSNGREIKVRLTSAFVAHRAVPCCPLPTFFAFIPLSDLLSSRFTTTCVSSDNVFSTFSRKALSARLYKSFAVWTDCSRVRAVCFRSRRPSCTQSCKFLCFCAFLPLSV